MVSGDEVEQGTVPPYLIYTASLQVLYCLHRLAYLVVLHNGSCAEAPHASYRISSRDRGLHHICIEMSVQTLKLFLFHRLTGSGDWKLWLSLLPM